MKKVAKISVVIVLLEIAVGFLVPWIFRDQIMAIGADENGNL